VDGSLVLRKPKIEDDFFCMDGIDVLYEEVADLRDGAAELDRLVMFLR